ncbi:MAG: hypothetical protein AAFY45_31310 [Bacteroidota bacterium]
MTHQIISIDDYLNETSQLAKKNRSRRIILFCTLFLAVISLGFGIYTSTEVIQQPDNQNNISAISVSNQTEAKFGKVYLAFDPDELNGVEDIEAFLAKRNGEDIESEKDNLGFPEKNWTEDEVRNQIVIKGNYFAGQ